MSIHLGRGRLRIVSVSEDDRASPHIAKLDLSPPFRWRRGKVGSSGMTRHTIVLAAAVALIAGAAGTAHALPFAASADATNAVTVSGTWTSVQWYESDGSWSGVGDSPAASDWDSHSQDNNPFTLSTTASVANGSASSSITVGAGPPTIDIDSQASVDNVQLEALWAMGYSMGGANWLTSGATQTVDITLDWSYDLDLVGAYSDSPEAYAKIYVAFWGPASDLMLTGDTEWVFVENGSADYLVKTVSIDTAGASTSDSGTEVWEVDVSDGSFYSFWGQADAMAFTMVPEPSTAALLSLGLLGIAAVRRRRAQ